jgi:hypothetical protein
LPLPINGNQKEKEGYQVLKDLRIPMARVSGEKNPLDFSPILASFFVLSAKADKTGVTGFLSSCRFVLPRARVVL